jgi:hypothetical protein
MCEARVEDREGWVLEVSVAGPVFGLYVFVASAVCVLLLLMRLRPAVGGHTHVLVCDSPNTVLGLPVLYVRICMCLQHACIPRRTFNPLREVAQQFRMRGCVSMRARGFEPISFCCCGQLTIWLAPAAVCSVLSRGCARVRFPLVVSTEAWGFYALCPSGSAL